jgi:hypothetical protein
MAMYKLNKKDTISPASISGLFGMYTTNKTWFAMFFQSLYFNEDKWRVSTGGGLGSVNFQFFLEVPPPIDSAGYIGYNTAMDFFMIKVQRRVYGDLFIGAFYQYMKFNSRVTDYDYEFANDELNGIGLNLYMDKRDDVYYPIHGSVTEVKWASYPAFMNKSEASNKIELDFNQYIGVRNNTDVVAARFYSGIGIGELSFNQQFVVGQTDIRGYTQGKFRGNYTVNIQGEYRWNFYKNLSAVGFVGLATVFDSANESHDGQLLPGVGTGFRVNVFPKYHMNVGIDVAAGKDDWGVYFRIGEAF